MRSNPVTYLKAYDDIRKLFAEQPYAKHNGFTPSSFSFNMAGGRCEECQGEGVIRVGMQFMADVELVCESCGGKRFKDEILEVKYHGYSIYDILEMTVNAAVELFSSHMEENPINKKIVEKLSALQRVGAWICAVGTVVVDVVGVGRGQRVKLASFPDKGRVSAGPILFIFDEPTTGLQLPRHPKAVATPSMH